MPLQPAQLSHIAQRIEQGFCVPILGAAANIKSANLNYDGLLLGAEVSEALAHGINEPIADKKNLQKVSLVYEVLLKRLALVQRLKTLLPDTNCQPSHLLQVLASLPFELYITTNYDRLLERALAPRNPMVVVQTPSTLEGRALVDEWSLAPSGQRRPLVYKIHGSFKDPVADGGGPPKEHSPVIITEDDYIDFLTLLGSKEHGVPKKIGEMLKDSDLLFLGYSLEDWDFRALYKVVMGSFDENGFPPSRFSIQWKPPQYWEKFWTSRGVEVVDQDIYEFADELQKAYEELHV